MNIDLMLEKCGDFHRYQLILLLLFSIVNILSSMNYYSQTIISFVPEHWCYSKSLANSSIPEIKSIYSNYSDPSCTSLDHKTSATNETEKCSEWIYNHDHGYVSMTSELNWVCQDAWRSAMGQSAYFIGSVFGTLVFGVLADIYGRIPILILAHSMGAIGSVLTIFARDMFFFGICRMISGFATDSNFFMMYILVLEYMRPSMRTFGLNLTIGIFYTFGSAVTPWTAVWLGTWKLYLLGIVLPTLTVPFFYFIMSESAQWLISKGRVDEAIQNFRRIAKINKKILDEDFVKEFRDNLKNAPKPTTKSGENANMLDLFRTPRLRKLTLICFFKSMVITLCYDAISKNVEGMGTSPFIMFSVSAVAILPACLVLLALQDKIGRKAMASSSLLVSGIFTTATGIAIAYQKNYQDPYLLGTLAFIGRFGVSVAYNSAAQYATELIPTCVRGQGVAAVHVAGYALTFFSSYILYLANIFKPLPSLVLGILSLIGAFLCLFLPETLNRSIPITLEDGENFGRGERFFHFACFEKPNKTESKITLATKL